MGVDEHIVAPEERTVPLTWIDYNLSHKIVLRTADEHGQDLQTRGSEEDHPELSHQIAHVHAHRLRRDEQRLPDLAVGRARDQTLDTSEITNDFTFDDNVTVSVAKDTDWSEFDGPSRSSVDDALSGIMGTTHIHAESVDPFGQPIERDGSGDVWVGDFTGEYTDAYDKTREFFNGEGEGFRDQDEDSEEQ